MKPPGKMVRISTKDLEIFNKVIVQSYEKLKNWVQNCHGNLPDCFALPDFMLQFDQGGMVNPVPWLYKSLCLTGKSPSPFEES